MNETNKFERLMRAIERELVDLKTTCRRGLGSIRFYQKTKPVQKTGTDITIQGTITIASGEPLPAFLTVATPLGMQVISTADGQNTYTTYQMQATSSSTTWSGSYIVTSSSLIDSVEVTVS